MAAKNPNTQLIKLAVGVAGVAAVAGLTGTFSALGAAPGRQDQATTQDSVTAQSPNTTTPRSQLQSRQPQTTTPLWTDDDDDEGEHHESQEHSGGTQFARPGFNNAGSAAPTQRTRSRHS